MDVKDVGSDKARRDTVDTAEINPFDGKTLGQLHYASFGSVILRIVST
jgi:hypothetical protein